MQQTAPHAPVHGVPRQPERGELCEGDNAAVRSGEAGDLAIRGAYVAHTAT
jgi:hypothetical protein